MNSVLTKVVIVDDDPQFLQMMSKVALKLSFQSDTFLNPDDFWENTYKSHDVLVLDLSMPGCDGIEFIRKLAHKKNQMQIVLCSGQDKSILKAAKDLVVAHKLNLITALQKPVSIKSFKQLLLDSKHDNQKRKTQKFDFNISKERLDYALYSGEVVPHYQPQVDLKTGEVIGFEALCRWETEEYGLVPPNLFLPVIKKNELLGAVTNRMLRKSTSDIVVLNNELSASFNISVNIDASDVSSLDFPEFIESVVNESGFAAEQLMLEITESGMMGKLTDSLDILARLRMKNVSLSIDDFGTGYSSLSMLHKMPFNELKIDQSFVRSMMADKTSLAIVETSILLANKIGVLTVAEGIEDQNTYEFLRDVGCQVGQGYFIGKPMPINEVPEWFHSWNKSELGLG